MALHGKYTLMNKGNGLYYGWVVTQVWGMDGSGHYSGLEDGWMGSTITGLGDGWVRALFQVWRMDGWVVLSQGWGMDGSGHYHSFGGWMAGWALEVFCLVIRLP